MFGGATAAQCDTNGDRMSQDEATGMTADELRSSRTTAIAALVARYAHRLSDYSCAPTPTHTRRHLERRLDRRTPARIE
jgi:hypothetical protein